MMMPMEDLPSNSNESSPSSTDNEHEIPERPRPSNQAQSLNSPSRTQPSISTNFKRILCYCCCCSQKNDVPQHKIQPVIFQPLNDVYLQLKPNRRLRVIHLNSQGALPNSQPYYFQNSQTDSDSDDDYWFVHADPKRPKIKQPPASHPPKRIFHKLEPQVRPTFEELSPSNLNSNIQGRLPRKAINTNAIDDDEDEEAITDDDFKSKTNASNASPSSSLKKEVDLTEKSLNSGIGEVLTLPEPGESSTDPDETNDHNTECPDQPKSDVTASIREAGQKLGGEANVAFESEEEYEDNDDDTIDVAIKSPNVIKKDVDKGEDDDENEDEIRPGHQPQNFQQSQPVTQLILPAVFFIHGVGGSASIWTNQLTYFASLGHEVIAPDLLGKYFRFINAILQGCPLRHRF